MYRAALCEQPQHIHAHDHANGQLSLKGALLGLVPSYMGSAIATFPLERRNTPTPYASSFLCPCRGPQGMTRMSGPKLMPSPAFTCPASQAPRPCSATAILFYDPAMLLFSCAFHGPAVPRPSRPFHRPTDLPCRPLIPRPCRAAPATVRRVMALSCCCLLGDFSRETALLCLSGRVLEIKARVKHPLDPHRSESPES
jgi:hypothetical protein